MKRYKYRYTYLLLALLTLSLQSCMGSSSNSNGDQFKTKITTINGGQVGISDQAVFKGKIYFTIDHNLYTLDGSRNPKQLTHNLTVESPVVSPDGKWVAFDVRYPNYSDLAYMSVDGGALHVVATGKGQFYAVGDGTNNYYWFMQPTWSPDSKNLLFLSDLQKQFYWKGLGAPFSNAYFSDLQIFSLPIGQPKLTASQAFANAQVVAYAAFGDGGDRDAIYRPNHNDQIAFTHYQYDPTGTQQIIQIFMENPDAIANSNPGTYTPLNDPAIAITPDNTNKQCLEPAFSPNGNFIAYIQRMDTTHMGLYVMPVAEDITQTPNNPATVKKALGPYNSKSSLLQSGLYISQPFWSPDGKQIGYLSYSNDVFDIWLANVTLDAKTGTYKTVGNPVQLTSANGHLDGESRPFWIA